MSEETELQAMQAKIAALAGHINKHKQQPSSQEGHRTHAAHSETPYHMRDASRWSPYLRGGRPAFHPVKHRTLVLGNTGHKLPKSVESNSPAVTAEPFVASRAGGKAQLMTKETYEREQRHRQEYLQRGADKTTRPAPQHASHNTQDISASAHANRVLEFDGIKFELQPDGGKLVRLPDLATKHRETPKKVTIANVNFLRTKSGNLVRATATTQNNMRPGAQASKKQCDKFTRYGACPFGPSCRNRHDPTKIAICKEFFTKGSCPAGKSCDLSHEPDYHRVPACTYFLRGNCTNSACRYAHVDISPSTLVCRPFATLGYCSKGVECGSRHVFECPDYTNKGRCEAREKGLCPLPHVDRAGALRKAAKRQGRPSSEDDTDVSSDEEEHMNANDTDDNSEIDINMDADDDSHELIQQQDFIQFASHSRK